MTPNESRDGRRPSGAEAERPPRSTRALTIAAFALLAGCEGASPELSGAQSVGARPPATAPAQISTQIDGSRRTAITQAVERIAPAVVTVQTETVERVPADVYEQFFGGRSGERVGAGIGSGFVMREDGVIVTNAHVIAGATRVSVMMRDGTTYPAEILGADETNDLAVLKIKARNLPVALLGNSDELLIGEWAIAIGNPFGFVLGNTEPSVTTGVISATGRNLVSRGEGNGMYLDMVQTDASINPGNSGGPLVNAIGQVIGVNSSIYSPSGGSIGIGFAIPINRARRVTDDLLEHGAIRRPWIGEKVEAARSDNPRDVLTAGVVLRSVVPGSPAARAGLQPGDRLVSVNGRSLRNPFDWEAARLALRVGETAKLVVRRGARDLIVNVTVADLPEVSAPKLTVLRELELVTLTPAIRVERGVRAPRGAVVFRVSSRLNDEIGLQEGDVILQVNQIAITQAADVARAFDSYGGRGVLRMVFERNGFPYQVDFRIRQ